MAEFRCFDTYILNNYSSSDYTKKKKRKTLFENAQTIAIGNSNYQQGISVNAIPPGYLPKSNGSTYYAPVYVGTKGDSRCLLGANSYDILYDVLYGAKPSNNTYKQIATDITDSLSIPLQDWVGNIMQINFKSDANPDSMIGPAICDIPANGTPNKMYYATRQDFLPKYDDANPPEDFPGMIIDPSYNVFYPQCSSKYKTNNYLKNIKYNSNILFPNATSVPSAVTFINNKLYQNVKTFPYPLDFSASRCLTEQELIDIFFPPPPPPIMFYLTSGDSFEYGEGISVIYNGTDRWVAVGSRNYDVNAGYSILTSVDGKVWSRIIGTQFNNKGYSVSYGNSRWVAVGADDPFTFPKTTMLTSTDGLNWTQITGVTFTGEGLFVTYGNKQWVAVGSGGDTVLTSNDGITWIGGLGSTFLFDNGKYAVVGMYNRWVAVGAGTDKIIYSDDNGISWGSSLLNTFTNGGNTVKYASGRFIAVGDDGGGPNTILYSDNGIEWNTVAGTTFSNTGISIAYGKNGRWVAVGNDAGGSNSILVSYDNGFFWQSVIGPIANFYGTSVKYADGRWIAVGYSNINSYTILTSSDGTYWENIEGESIVTGNSISYGKDGSWVAVGYEPSILYGYEAITPTLPQPEFDYVFGTIFGNPLTSNSGTGYYSMYNNIDRWIALGNSNFTPPNNTILTSIDGINWETISGNQFTGSGRSVAYEGGTWIAVGSGTNTILSSMDGINWGTIAGTEFTNTGRSVAYGGGRWVAVGSGTNTILTSIDGINWEIITGTQFTNSGICVAYSGGRWVAVGEDTSSPTPNTILYSDNGVNWNVVSGTQFLTRGNFVLYGGGKWIAGGYDNNGTHTILYSINGISWSTTTGSYITSVSNIAYSGNIYVACGSDSGGSPNTILYSLNGINWLSTNVVGYTMNHVVYANNYWIAVGAVIYISNDGITWNIPNYGIPVSNGNHIAYGGGNWIITGAGGILGRSILQASLVYQN